MPFLFKIIRSSMTHGKKSLTIRKPFPQTVHIHSETSLAAHMLRTHATSLPASSSYMKRPPLVSPCPRFSLVYGTSSEPSHGKHIYELLPSQLCKYRPLLPNCTSLPQSLRVTSVTSRVPSPTQARLAKVKNLCFFCTLYG